MHSWITPLKIYADGNVWSAVSTGFKNLQESPAGFGDTPLEAAYKFFYDDKKYAFLGNAWWDWRVLIPYLYPQWLTRGPNTFDERSPDIFIIKSEIFEADVYVYCFQSTLYS